MTIRLAAAFAIPFAFSATAANAQEYPEPQRGTYVVENSEFQTGEVLQEMNVGYPIIGDLASSEYAWNNAPGDIDAGQRICRQSPRSRTAT